ncbi:MAG: class I SAM-dependent methyltransferase [Actinomycetota bacterium]
MSENRVELTARALEEWDKGSAGWIRNADLIDRMSSNVREWMVDRVDPQPGDTVLELACGAGNTGFDVARRLGDTGRLIQTDISPSMVAATTERAKAAGLGNIEFRVMDAQSIDLEDGSADGVIHRYGPMLLPDPDASFREVRRVLRDDGCYVTAVWAGPDRNPWIMAAGMSVIQNGVELPGDPFGPGGMFSLSDPEVFRQRVAAAGFSHVDIELVENPFEFTDFDEFWKQPSEIAGPIANIIAKLPEDRVAAIKQSYRTLSEPFRDGEAYRPPALTVCLVARP